MDKKILTVTLNPCIDKTIIVDGFVYGGLNRAKSIRVDIGGKGINVSKVLHNYGASVLACGMIAGKQGVDVIDYLDNRNILHSFTTTEGELRTNYKIVDSNSRITTEINEPGFHPSPKDVETCIKNIVSMLPSAEIMVLSGSVPAGVDVDVYKRLIEIAKDYDVKVILDADGERLKLGIKALPYAIKPNLFEFEQLVEMKLDSYDKIISAAKKYIDQGIHIVIISMGADGAILVSDREAYLATPFAIDCKSTVGAGDSMVAAMAYCLQQGYDMETMARFAVASGSITASKEGTEVCTLAEVQKALYLIKIGKL